MNYSLKVIALVNTLFTFATILITPAYALFVEKIGGNVALAGMLFSISFITGFVADLFLIRFKDRSFMDERMIKINYGIKSVCWLILVFAPSIPMLIFVQAVMGIGDAFGTPAFVTLYGDNLDKKSHLREWGIWELIKNPAVAVAAFSSGFIIDWFGFRGLFLIMSLIGFASLFLFQKFYKKKVAS